MFDMRLRLPELMAARGIKTAYALSTRSRGALPISTAHRLVKADGHPDRIDLATLDVLCDVLDVPPTELFERDPRREVSRKRRV